MGGLKRRLRRVTFSPRSLLSNADSVSCIQIATLLDTCELQKAMVPPQHLEVLRKIITYLKNVPIDWVVTGSFGMALQGVPVEVHDVDIQTSKQGAYEMEKLLAEYVVKPVCYSESERIRSHLGMLSLDGVQVEIMGDIQKRLANQSWEKPVEVERHRLWIEIGGMRIPVLSLEYEYQAYLKLGRTAKAEMLRSWLRKAAAD